MNTRLVTLAILLGACNGKGASDPQDGDTIGDDSAAPDDSGTAPIDDTAACAAELAGTAPAADASNTSLDATINATFTERDETATIALVNDITQEPVPGTTAWLDDGATLVFTPDTWLSPQTRYVADIQWCTGQQSLTFFTNSGEGLPPDPATITGTAYRVDLKEGTWTEPGSLGSFLAAFLAVDLLVQVQSVDGKTLSLLGAFTTIEEKGQDFCEQTLALEADYSAAPAFAYGPGELTLPYAGSSLVMHEFQLSGSFTYDGETVEDVTLEAQVDMREAVAFAADLLNVDNADEMCEFVTGFGSTCEPCPDGEPYCLPVRVEDAPTTSTETVLEVVEELYCHESCEYRDEYPQCQ